MDVGNTLVTELEPLEAKARWKIQEQRRKVGNSESEKG
jgi:hypothetical protein